MKKGILKEMEIKVGDKVIAPMQFGYAPVHGVVDEIWVNAYGVKMASINYGSNTEGIDWMSDWHRTIPVKSLEKED